MKILADTKTDFFDVDDTLVIWRANPSKEEQERLIFVQDNHGTVALLPNLLIIKDLKEAKNCGHNVVVWSQGGSEWAASVIECLGLEKYVDLIMPKPDRYFDDLDAGI